VDKVPGTGVADMTTNGYFDNRWRHGDGTNYTEFEGDGFLHAERSARGWDDMRAQLITGKITGANQPTFTTFRGQSKAYQFVDGDEIWITNPLDHGWAEGTLIYPHIHWSPSPASDPAANVGLGWDFVRANLNEEFPVFSTQYTRDVSTGVNHGHWQLLHDIPSAGLDMTGYRIDTFFVIRVFRQAAAVDNYASPIFIHTFDFHVLNDTMGSREILAK
jgi:hypothetical protein